MLFSAEVGRDFTPLLGFPFDDGVTIVVGLEPDLSTGDNLEELLRLGSALELRLTLALLNPENGIVRVGIDGFIVQALVPAKGKGMDDGEELPNIVRAMNGAEMEHAIARLQVDGLVLHRTRIATAGSIHRPRICPYLWRQGQNLVVAVCRGIQIINLQFSIFNKSHALWHLDAQQTHGILDNLGNIAGQYQTEELLLLIGLVKDRVVVIELIEHLRQLVAVVGDA